MAIPHPSRNARQQFLLAALVAAVGTIPLMVNINSIALIFLVFACFIQQPWSQLKAKLIEPSLWMIPVVYFLWVCCSYFWDSTGGFAIRDVERYAMLFFIPPALAVLPRMPQYFLRITGAVFIAVTIGICIGCLARSFHEYQTTSDYRVFFYHYLAQQMNLNAIFLSNYCLAGIIWLLYYGFIQKAKRRPLAYVVIILVSLFLFGMILMLSSKLIIFLTLLLMMFTVLYIGYIRKYFVQAFVIIILFLAGGVVMVKQLKYVNWRMSVTSVKKYSGPQDNNNGLSIRIMMWHTAWDLIKERPLLGYGAKGARVEVIKRYKEENFELGYSQGYHSHNQYLQSALLGGIPALLLLLAMLIKMGWEGFRKNNILLVLLLFHFVCQAVIESAFEVQQELVFYMLFLFLFYYHPVQVISPEDRVQEG
jgi:O-antigen ligase